MALSEFNLIEHYFSRLGCQREDTVLAVGDDCALLKPPPGKLLAVSIDTLVAGVHFFADTDPENLGHKSLAVNLSDLAAMGAEPAWATLALTLPQSDPDWLSAFSRGFSALAIEHNVQLVGGDTTQGPLSVTVQVQGFVQPDHYLSRAAARPGDLIYVTGSLGDAGLALAGLRGQASAVGYLDALQSRLERPEPRIAAGQAFAGIAGCGIDISDGLLADLGHICAASGAAARVELDRIPLSAAVRAYIAETGDWQTVVSSGDDYELCVTVPELLKTRFEEAVRSLDLAVSLIGRIEPGAGVCCVDGHGNPVDFTAKGYDHFQS